MLRLCAGLALVTMVATAQADQPGESLASSSPVPLTIIHVNADADFRFAPRSGTTALPYVPNATPGRSEFGDGASQPPALSWHPTYGGISLRNLSTVEIKVAEAYVVLRRHSVSIDGGQYKLTFSPDSALIEKDGIQVMLQPHSTSIAWIKAF